MKLKDWLQRWKLMSLRISVPYLEAEWAPQAADQDAAWELYIELLTRITTQPLPEDSGDEAAALQSVYTLFGLTRDTIKRHGRGCQEFTKVAVVVLNQVVRPFTAKWHKRSLSGTFQEPASRAEFRGELATLQTQLGEYTRMLADLAGVEDLTRLEASEGPGRR